ncbi:hypothetical protein HNE05_16340 [Aquipseudomonas campi]|uniref:Uncharacterized protein n=1 Tax=Aquipseudomonas campi TaxID=2731681 RepID=A0A6M8FKG7_9GAMM|nr:hypothetical protein [Pseudomonas campi]QKE64852.1 hypothetical protein HNE05_16340 [Pseudomonas campi]
MNTVGLLIALSGFIWSVARGIQVSLLCCVLNFIFPPIAQAIFAIYEPAIRFPLLVLVSGLGLMYTSGGLQFG